MKTARHALWRGLTWSLSRKASSRGCVILLVARRWSEAKTTFCSFFHSTLEKVQQEELCCHKEMRKCSPLLSFLISPLLTILLVLHTQQIATLIAPQPQMEEAKGH